LAEASRQKPVVLEATAGQASSGTQHPVRKKKPPNEVFGGFAVVGLFGVQHLIQAGWTQWNAVRAIGYYEPVPL
jgi:hypothetical protein